MIWKVRCWVYLQFLAESSGVTTTIHFSVTKYQNVLIGREYWSNCYLCKSGYIFVVANGDWRLEIEG